MQDAVTVPDASLRSLGSNLISKGYQVFVRDTSLYAFKGLAGKYGPLGVHASMLAVMAGMPCLGILHGVCCSPSPAWLAASQGQMHLPAVAARPHLGTTVLFTGPRDAAKTSGDVCRHCVGRCGRHEGQRRHP